MRVLQAKTAHELAESWGCDQVYCDPRPYILWRCRGVAAHLKADVKRDASVAEKSRHVYQSEVDLDAEMEYTRCESHIRAMMLPSLPSVRGWGRMGAVYGEVWFVARMAEVDSKVQGDHRLVPN